MNSLKHLASNYRKNNPPSLKHIIAKIKKNEELLISLLAMGASITGIVSKHGVDFDKITPQMEEAFNLAFPNLELSHLENLEPEQLTGFISNWKGKYFEVLVRDELNAGNTIGDITLLDGQYAELAESVTQPGWDLQILDENGITLDQLQLKATNSVSYINETLERYPEFEIIGSTEISTSADILNSNIANDTITDQISNIFENVDSVIPDLVYDILPFSGMIIITTLEGRKYLTGKASLNDFAKNTLAKGTENAIYTIGGSALFSIFDSGIISVGVPMATKIFMNWRKNSYALKDDLKIYSTNLNKYKLTYQT